MYAASGGWLKASGAPGYYKVEQDEDEDDRWLVCASRGKTWRDKVVGCGWVEHVGPKTYEAWDEATETSRHFLRLQWAIDWLVQLLLAGRRNPGKSVKVTPAVASVFQTDVQELVWNAELFDVGHEELVQLEALESYISEDASRLYIPTLDFDKELVWRALTDLSNTYDDMVEDGKSLDPAFDRRVAKSLGTLAAKVLR